LALGIDTASTDAPTDDGLHALLKTVIAMLMNMVKHLCLDPLHPPSMMRPLPQRRLRGRYARRCRDPGG
jgi:hypothetical protein